MKYLTFLSKQILYKNTEITNQVKNPLYSPPLHKHTFTKLDSSHNEPSANHINDHISYLHRKHTEEFIHEKEMENQYFGFSPPNFSKYFCCNICDKLLLFPKY